MANEVARPTTSFQAELDTYTPNFLQALPPHVSVEKFKRVLMTAAGQNPELIYANRRTLILSAVKCASDGLLPDGREAALVVFNTEVKQRDPQTGLDKRFKIDAVSYMPMIAGIRKRMRNTGDVLSADAEVVCKNDRFKYRLGDDPYLEHEPPPLDQERGEIIGAYARIVLRSGEVLRDVMSRKEIEASRQQGRAKNSLMWDKFYGEGCKKTVLRRCAKAAPQAAEFEAMLARDEELPALPPGEHLALTALAEPEPDLAQMVEDDEPAFEVVDHEGTAFVFTTAETAARALAQVYEAAAALGLAQLEGAQETNAATVEALIQAGEGDLAVWLTQEYDRLRQPPKEAQRSPPAQGKPSAPKDAPKAAAPATARAQPAAAAPEDKPFPGDAPPAAADGTPLQSNGQPVQEARNVERLVPRDRPATIVEADRVIPPVERGGKPDWRTWTLALFLPKLRRETDGTELAMLIADNDENLKAARAALGKAELAELENAIAKQWEQAPAT